MSEEQVSFLCALIQDQTATLAHLDQWLVPALRQVDYGEIAKVIIKMRAENARLTVENDLLKAEPGQSLVLRCGELEADVARLTERVSELTEQANAAYAPYREQVMAAREEVQRLSALIGMKDDALNSFAEFYDKCAKAAGYEGGVYSEEMDAKILAKIGGE